MFEVILSVSGIAFCCASCSFYYKSVNSKKGRFANMEKVTVKICGREYSLKTDESPEKIIELAHRLEKTITYVGRKIRGMSEIEFTTMGAMILIGEIESTIHKEKEYAEQLQKQLEGVRSQLSSTNAKLDEQLRLAADNTLEQDNRQLKTENASLKEQLSTLSADSTRISSEMQTLAQRRAAESADYEKKLKDLTEEHELEIMILKEGFEKTTEEKDRLLEEKTRENEKMQTTLSNYEASFDLYVKKKEEELRQAHEETEALKAKNAELEKQLEKSGDIQMKIC